MSITAIEREEIGTRELRELEVGVRPPIGGTQRSLLSMQVR
jgi:hypothetical protein